MNIFIDPEFQALVHPLTTDEYIQRETNLLAEGCRDALVVWAVVAPPSGDDGGPEAGGGQDDDVGLGG